MLFLEPAVRRLWPAMVEGRPLLRQECSHAARTNLVESVGRPRRPCGVKLGFSGAPWALNESIEAQRAGCQSAATFQSFGRLLSRSRKLSSLLPLYLETDDSPVSFHGFLVCCRRTFARSGVAPHAGAAPADDELLRRARFRLDGREPWLPGLQSGQEPALAIGQGESSLILPFYFCALQFDFLLRPGGSGPPTKSKCKLQKSK